MKPGYVLRQVAESDLEDIWLYIFNNWGLEQADAYLEALLNRLAWLAEHPHAGKERSDIKSGYFCFPEGRHLIFYQQHSNRVEIFGIVHQSMDYPEYLDFD